MTKMYGETLSEIIKNKEIFFVFEDFNLEFGGITNTVFKRANYLAEKGYKINLLTVDYMKNFDYILREFQRLNILSENINFINIFDYYFNKYSSKNTPKFRLDANKNDEHVIKRHNEDNSISVDYYDETNTKLIKSELYIDNVLVSINDINNKIEFFTYDGFKYLELIGNTQVILYNPDFEKTIKFNSLNDFLYHIIDELCDEKNKPFLVCDSTSHWHNLNGIKSDAYKIGVMHGNPYVFDNEPIDYLSPRINHLSHLDDLETLVVLTNEVKQDLINEFKKDKFTVIPNFISDEVLQTELAPKDLNRIGIFSRISPEKQISDAIEAFKIVTKDKPEALLEIYGRALTDNEKKELEKLKGLVKNLNLEENVLFKGYLEDVNIEMQKSLCTLLTSKHEGLPMALIESMSNATPVICYDFKYAPKDVITDGIDGIVVKKGNTNQLAEEMIKLLNNPQFAIDLGMNAREKIRNEFSTSSVGYKWEMLFQKVFVNSTLNDLAKKNKEIKKLKQKNKKLEKLNNQIINSNSWKITKPFRKLMKFLKFKK